MTATAFDLSAIRARALADPGKPAGACRWCGEPFDGGEQQCTSADGFRWCQRPSTDQIAAHDRAALVAEVGRRAVAIVDAAEVVSGWERRASKLESALTNVARERDAARAELDRLHEAIADFARRMRSTVHGQRNGDADEVRR